MSTIKHYIVLVLLLSHVQLFVTPWIITQQAPLSMGFPRQEYWSGLSFPSPGDLPNQVIKLRSSAWEMDSLPLSHQGSLLYSPTVLNILYSIFVNNL